MTTTRSSWNIVSLSFLAILGLQLLIAGQASAAVTTTIGGFTTFDDGDKRLTNQTTTLTGFTALPSATPVLFAPDNITPGKYALTLGNAANPLTSSPLMNNTFISYSISIIPNILNNPFNTIVAVGIASDTDTLGTGTSTVTKNIYSDANRTNLIGSISSVNGSQATVFFASLYSTLYITETFASVGNKNINSSTNNFEQAFINPVPEPASLAVWTILAGVFAGARRRFRVAK